MTERGCTCASAGADYTAPLAVELEDAFGVIRSQQRGLAPSTTPGPFSIGQHVGDAIAVLDAAGVGRAWVIGHSRGAHLAMHLAVRHPGRVAGLVIAHPLGAVPDGGLSDMEQNLTQRIRPELVARARELATSGPWPARAPPRRPGRPGHRMAGVRR